MVGRIYHVGLTVSDLERSIAFYRDVLGLEFQGEIFMEGGRNSCSMPFWLNCCFAVILIFCQNPSVLCLISSVWPADVIAVKNGIPVLIDCKECATHRFPLSRIEGNQEGAMTLWEQTGNEHCYFAMKLKDGRIYMVSFDELMLRQLYGEGTITEKEFPQYKTFRQWVEEFE